MFSDPLKVTKSLVKQHNFQVLFQAVPGLYLVLMPNPDFTIVDASEPFLKATRTKLEDITGKGLFEVFPNNPFDSIVSGTQNLRDSLARVTQQKIADKMAIQKNQCHQEESNTFEDRYWNPTNTPIIGKDNHLDFIIHRVQDVTEIIKHQQKIVGTQLPLESKNRTEQIEIDVHQWMQELQNTQNELKSSQEYQKKIKELYDTICHEIRNPLNGIYGGASLLRDTLRQLSTLIATDNPTLSGIIKKAEAELDIIYISAKQQTNIVNNVLIFSQLENGKVVLNPIPFELKGLLNTVKQIFQFQTNEKNLQLNIILPENMNTFLKADNLRLNVILNNLISNALKFTAQGSITLAVSPDPNSSTDNPILHFSVKDTGIGMTKDMLEVLFNRFEQTGPHIATQYGGSGLGLSICKKLVEMMGGKFHVESNPGEGTEFSFTMKCSYLTLSERNKMIATQNKRVHRSKSTVASQIAHKSILIVEDASTNQNLLAAILLQQGCQYEIAQNGKEAVEVVERLKNSGSKPFDLILMDFQMPIMGGLEATIAIRKIEEKLNYRTPIIGLSANTVEEVEKSAKQFGMDGCLTKPYKKDQLIAIIARHTLLNAGLEKQHGALPNQVSEQQDSSPSAEYSASTQTRPYSQDLFFQYPPSQPSIPSVPSVPSVPSATSVSSITSVPSVTSASNTSTQVLLMRKSPSSHAIVFNRNQVVPEPPGINHNKPLSEPSGQTDINYNANATGPTLSLQVQSVSNKPSISDARIVSNVHSVRAEQNLLTPAKTKVRPPKNKCCPFF